MSYPRLCWEVGVFETLLRCYSRLLVCLPKQIWFRLANQAGREVADLPLVAWWVQPACLLPRSCCGAGMQTPTRKRVLCSIPFQNLPHKCEVVQRHGRAVSAFHFSVPPLLWHEKDKGLLVTPPHTPYTSGSFKIGWLLSRVALQSPPPQTHGNWQRVRAFVTPGCTWDLWIPEHMDFPRFW